MVARAAVWERPPSGAQRPSRRTGFRDSLGQDAGVPPPAELAPAWDDERASSVTSSPLPLVAQSDTEWKESDDARLVGLGCQCRAVKSAATSPGDLRVVAVLGPIAPVNCNPGGRTFAAMS